MEGESDEDESDFQQRETMVNAAKAMYILRLATPRISSMSASEMAISKNQIAQGSVR